MAGFVTDGVVPNLPIITLYYIHEDREVLFKLLSFIIIYKSFILIPRFEHAYKRFAD